MTLLPLYRGWPHIVDQQGHSAYRHSTDVSVKIQKLCNKCSYKNVLNTLYNLTAQQQSMKQIYPHYDCSPFKVMEYLIDSRQSQNYRNIAAQVLRLSSSSSRICATSKLLKD